MKGKKMKKVKLSIIAILVIALAVTAGLFAGCKVADPEVIIETVIETVTETVEVEAEVVEGEKFTVGYSNGLITHSWRTQMTADVVQEFGYYKGLGWVDELLFQHAGFDVDLQNQQIRNLINAGVDLLLINPNSASAHDPIIEEAVEAGILVIIPDQLVTSELAYQIIPDQDFWMGTLTEYVMERIDYEGDIVYMSGYDGSPANTDRDTGFMTIIEQYPDVNLLAKVNGNWDPSTAQQVMADTLAAFPKIDAVVTQDGMSLGVVKAFIAANRPVPIMNGEGMIPFMDIWKELRDSEGYEAMAIANGPGTTSNTALGVGLRMLRGETLKDGYWNQGGQVRFIILEPVFDNDTLDAIYDEHITLRGITEYIDAWPSQEELDSYFE
jgi:ribose transport system substrate-binding protein